jgi:hypothetical protein
MAASCSGRESVMGHADAVAISQLERLIPE